MSYESEPWPIKENDVIKLERSEARRVTLMYEVRLEYGIFEAIYRKHDKPCKRGKNTLNIMMMIRNEKTCDLFLLKRGHVARRSIKIFAIKRQYLKVMKRVT